MLGKGLLDELGGHGRVEIDEKLYRVSHLDNDAAFRQLTEAPPPVNATGMLRALPAFEAYLEPIGLPIGPCFRRMIPLVCEGEHGAAHVFALW